MTDLLLLLGYSGPGTGTERCLSYDEKPLLLFQKLKETDQSPVFMLRHIVRCEECLSCRLEWPC